MSIPIKSRSPKPRPVPPLHLLEKNFLKIFCWKVTIPFVYKYFCNSINVSAKSYCLMQSAHFCMPTQSLHPEGKHKAFFRHRPKTSEYSFNCTLNMLASLSSHEDSSDFFFKYVFRNLCMWQSLLNLSKLKFDITLSIFIISSFNIYYTEVLHTCYNRQNPH